MVFIHMWNLAGHVLRIQQTVPVLCKKHQYLEKCFYHNVPEVSWYFFETIGKMKEHDYLIF